jgi:hypothetical protein
MRVKIIWSNAGGQLAEVTADEGYDASVQLAAMVEDSGIINAGDVFTVVELEEGT